LNGFFRSSAIVLIWCAVVVLAACAKKAGEPATAEETAATAAAAPATVSEDLRSSFRAKVAEVDEYMKAHDVKNTPVKQLTAKLTGFRKDFDDLAAMAGDDEELAAQFDLAAEAMGLYAESLRAPAGDMSSLELALDAEAKWVGAKKAAPGEPRP
jgi:hypothetical protein